MTEFITDAVVLREVPYKENDRILTVLTPDSGLMTVGAKGVRNIKSKNSAAVQLFCYSELEIMQYGSRFTLKTATLKNGFFGLREDLNRYALACYAADTVCSFCTSENDESEPFRLLLNMFYALSENKEKPLWQIKAAYELKLCSVCGFMPDLESCAQCGRLSDGLNKPDDAFRAEGKYTFSLTESGLLCKDCFQKAEKSASVYAEIPRSYTLALSYPALMAARYVTHAEIPRFLSFKLAETAAPDFCEFAERYLLHLAERGFDTLKYYKTLLQTL